MGIVRAILTGTAMLVSTFGSWRLYHRLADLDAAASLYGLQLSLSNWPARVQRALLIFTYRGADDAALNLPGEPMLDPVESCWPGAWDRLFELWGRRVFALCLVGLAGLAVYFNGNTFFGKMRGHIASTCKAGVEQPLCA